MIGKRFWVIFVDDLGYITPDNGLTTWKLDVGHLAKHFKTGAYWIITVERFNPENAKLTASLHSAGMDAGPRDFPWNN